LIGNYISALAQSIAWAKSQGVETKQVEKIIARRK
jgi:hypothetical protein